ncbi:cytochrome P450 [Streptomyces bambusae]|uniref:cytochrome P450 n=1 Tax=Streptomyces bambusae TaxID=1550616 RepID=UPI001CFC8843|nr:cytochrome P450 [Streptomyces bambusae]MCB5167330.1 cytochrome P450 [Streptomyces bambusae]
MSGTQPADRTRTAPGLPLPGPRPLPLLGNLPELLTAPAGSSDEFLGSFHREYGDIFALTVNGERQIFVSSHELVAEMCADPRWQKSVHAALEEVRDFAGDGLFTAYGDEPNWAVAHRLLMPAFGPGAMRDYFPAMLDIADQMLTRWERFGPDARIDVADDMTRLTLDTIALCAFGVRLNSFYSEEMHPFVGAMVRSLVEAGARSERLPGLQPFLLRTNSRYREDLETMRRVTGEIIAARRAQPAGERPDDLLERMLTAVDPVTGAGLREENVRYQLATFLIAGHETTSGMLSFAVHALLTRPEVLRRARDTVDEVLGGRTPRFEDLARLGYLGQVLRETLRLHPTAPAFALTPDEDTTLGGYAVRAGESVLVNLPALHRDPAVWRAPEAFDPDRFAPERMAEIPAYAWLPFGHGARACIGRPFALQEAVLVLAMVLQRFDLEPADRDYELTVHETLTVKPAGLAVRARPRPAPVPAPSAAPTGSAAPAGADVPVEAATAPGHGTPLLVLYGSNGGGGEGLARTIAGDGAARGWRTTAAPLDEYAGRLPTEGAVLIVTSTYNGSPPDNARRFVAWLTEEEPDLTGVDYLVLGCGSLDWAATYQRVPALVDDAMAAAGGRRIRERGATDARTDFHGDWQRWYEPLWPVLAETYSVTETATAGPRFRVVEAAAENGDRGTGTAVVLENRELVRGPAAGTGTGAGTAAGAETGAGTGTDTGAGAGSKRHLEIRLPAGTSYRTGDYLCVLPENHPELVARLLDRLGLPAGQVCTVESHAPAGRLPLGRPLRLDDLLTRYVDLSAPASAAAVAELARRTPCPPERAALERLAGPEHAEEVLRPRLGVLDLLERFASCRVDLALLLELLPAPRPRTYSISSAAEEQDTVALTVSVIEGPARSGKGVFRGAGSDLLRRSRPSDRLTVAVTSPSEVFRPPADPAVPAVMIASGSGIAPFRGFVRARMAAAAEGRATGPTVLFFGCRHPQWDDLYAEEFAPHVAAGRLEVHKAYSRLPGSGVRYVQDRVWEQRERVRELLGEGAHVYVCGDAGGMGPAVEEVLGRIGAGSENPGDADGARWLEGMRAAGRYATDVF